MKELFNIAPKTFENVETVITNAGGMESHSALDIETVDVNGDLLAATEASKVICINLKCTMSFKSQHPL